MVLMMVIIGITAALPALMHAGYERGSHVGPLNITIGSDVRTELAECPRLRGHCAQPVRPTPPTGRAHSLRDSHSPAGRRPLTVLEQSRTWNAASRGCEGALADANLRRGLAGPQPGPQGLPAGASPTGPGPIRHLSRVAANEDPHGPR
jgi:hypothetical protein